jgi:type IV pilus assembly protein PilV
MTSQRFDRQHSGLNQAGVGMIEVLVALLIISIGLLGYAGLQLRALGSTEDAHYRSQAIAIAQDLSERIAVNPEAIDDYLLAANWGPLAPDGGKPNGWDACVDGPCTAQAMAQSDMLQLRWQAGQLLPVGEVAAADCGAAGSICITVSWLDTTPATCVPPADQCVRLEVVVWEPTP